MNKMAGMFTVVGPLLTIMASIQVVWGAPDIPFSFTFQTFSDSNCQVKSSSGEFSFQYCKSLPENTSVYVNGSFFMNATSFQFICDPVSPSLAVGTGFWGPTISTSANLTCMKSATRSYQPLCSSSSPVSTIFNYTQQGGKLGEDL